MEDKVPELAKCPFEHMLAPPWSALARTCRVPRTGSGSGAGQVCSPASTHLLESHLALCVLGQVAALCLSAPICQMGKVKVPASQRHSKVRDVAFTEPDAWKALSKNGDSGEISSPPLYPL